VTDEIENGKFRNYFFPELFLKYYQEVYPAKLVFVSFLENPNVKGRMVKALENMGIQVLQFRLDGKRPDLTKMDTLLGLLSSESSYFPEEVVELSLVHTKGGISALIHRLENPPRDSTEEKNENSSDKKSAQKKYKKHLQLEADIPDHFCCPITLSIMKDPVMSPSGHTYERKSIEEYLEKNKKDPITGAALTQEELRPNRALKDAITSFCEKNEITVDDDS